MAHTEAREAAVRSYREGDLSKRSFVRRLVQAGVSAEAAASYALLLAPEPAAVATTGSDYYGDHYDDLYDHYDFYERPAPPLPQPRYFPRQIVTADDLTADQDYFRERLRRHNRLLHGCGVIEGLRVALGEDVSGSQIVTVGCGAAIDPLGEEIVLPDDLPARVLELPYLVLDQGKRTSTGWGAGLDRQCLGGEGGTTAWLALGPRRSSSHPRPSINGEVCPGETVCEPSRLHDGAELVLLDEILPADCVQRDAPADDPAWRGQYFAYGGGTSPALGEGIPDLVRLDPAIDFDWATGAPDPGLPADGVMARWTRGLHLAAGRYRFTVTADDGVRLSVDGRRLIDAWWDQPPTTYWTEELLEGGRHNFELDWYENAGYAMIRLDWEALEVGWLGRYFSLPIDGSEPDLSQGGTIIRVDPAIGFDWGRDKPDPRLRAGGFAARWTRDLEVCDEGEYEFTVRASGGIRLYVDGVRCLDAWAEGPLAVRLVRRSLSRGWHTLRVDYHHRDQPAVAKLGWRRVGPLNPGCRAEPRDGYVVLAALRACEGRVVSVDDEWFSRARGFRRQVLGAVADLTARLDCVRSGVAGPALAQLVPGELVQGASGARALLVGHRLGGATEVRFPGTGIEAGVLPGGSDEWLPLAISVPPETPAGTYDVAVTTPACTVNGADFRVSLAVSELVVQQPPVAPTAEPTRFLPTELVPTFTPTLIISTALPTRFLPTGILPTGFSLPSRPSGFRPTRFDPGAFPGRLATEVRGIGGATGARLEAAGIGSLAALASSTPQEVAGALDRSEVWAMDRIVEAQRLLMEG